MTLIAGAFARCGPLPNGIVDELAANLSRVPEDRPIIRAFDRCVLIKVDIGAFGASAFEDGAEAATMMAGDPVLAAGAAAAHPSRTADLQAIHAGLAAGDLGPLRRACEAFSIAGYDAGRGRLTLATDKLGIRPLYYYMDAEIVVFASALRTLTALDRVRVRLDLKGLSELVSAGLPMQGRTPFAGISAVRPGHALRVDAEGVAAERYWRWDDVPESDESRDSLAQATYEAFRDAVARRARGDASTVAFLSGGLDSRCIVAALRDLGVHVHSFNFSFEGTQDQVYAHEFAAAAGTDHAEKPLALGEEPNWAALISKQISARADTALRDVERPRVVWHGFDGDFTLGLVNLSLEAVRAIRAGNVDGAIRAYIGNRKIFGWGRFVREAYRRFMVRAREEAMRAALDEIACEDPGKNLYVFHLLEECRDLIHDHFEEIDRNRVEYYLPFCDAQLIRQVLAVPLDWCPNHRFYQAVFDRFPEFTRSVPWQTYPNAVPCPIQRSEKPGTQWTKLKGKDAMQRHRANLRRRATRTLDEIRGRKRFPDPLIDRRVFRAMALAHRLGFGDYLYAFRKINALQKYWDMCEGEPLAEIGPDRPG